ncbi:aromatic amino acid exporter YddG [Enterovirga aerilata]|uniref:EamA family transporter n=1 Tax=Enterovirga aerilata TaxID=2730920 RepID=A0A849HVH6_9HYPH|nr:EamA family transporter [Enterovirga sp. DB1703]NNM71112.1 EamA family transporter [Enterovirga sp. DB1703]
MSSRAATLTGFGAAALWALLALFTAATGPVPPFQLLAMTFAIGGGLGVLSWPFRPGAAASLVQKPAVWALGVAGLFGYHALYFAALKLAPPAESGLINYLWPLLIVLFSSFLPGERLRAQHVAGALLGFAGVVVLVAGRGALEIRPEYWAGYLCAFACAFVWAGYSVLSRRVAAVPTDAVTGFCLATAALGFLCHLLFERTVWPQAGLQWAAVIANGLGPVGAAFYLWDIGMKRGDIRLLGIGSYAIPVVSTGILILAGFAEPTWSLALACALIASGAVVATMPASWRRR